MPLPDAIPTPRSGFQLEHLDGETLLYRHSLKKMIYLNESAASVWKLCDGQRTVDEIVNLLLQAYPEVADSLARDIDEALDHLVREGALRMSGQPERIPPAE
jgi:coenzyme PQQ biosynthesis protein PqqD